MFGGGHRHRLRLTPRARRARPEPLRRVHVTRRAPPGRLCGIDIDIDGGDGTTEETTADDGFEALFAAVYPRARAVALRILGSVPAAEDAAAEALARALAALPRRQREAIVLRHMAGYPERHVADALGVSVNTVKKHLQRGLARLRTTMTMHEGELDGVD